MFQKYEQSLNALDASNVYLIKKLSNCLLYEFERTKTKQEAQKIKEKVSQLYTKIRTNTLWAGRVADLLNVMSRKIKKMK